MGAQHIDVLETIADVTEGSQPKAKALGISQVRARGVVYRARHRSKLLSPTSSGKASGADVASLHRLATTESSRKKKRA